MLSVFFISLVHPTLLPICHWLFPRYIPPHRHSAVSEPLLLSAQIKHVEVSFVLDPSLRHRSEIMTSSVHLTPSCGLVLRKKRDRHHNNPTATIESRDRNNTSDPYRCWAHYQQWSSDSTNDVGIGVSLNRD
jgi:hypothetical protein